VPISSQGESQGSQGSETRVLDRQRIKRLHEYLGELETLLAKELEAMEEQSEAN
jgi:hypothetical protein